MSQPKEWTPCGYCFQAWAFVFDHIQPRSKGGSSRKSNLYPACQRCNSLLKDKLFPSLGAKREYVRQELIRRGIWKFPIVSALQEAFPSSPEVAEVLQQPVPLEPLAVAKAGRVAGRRTKKAASRAERRKDRMTPLQATCRCGCGLAFKPRTFWQRFLDNSHQRAYWKKDLRVDQAMLESVQVRIDQRLEVLEGRVRRLESTGPISSIWTKSNYSG